MHHLTCMYWYVWTQLVLSVEVEARFIWYLQVKLNKHMVWYLPFVHMYLHTK